MSVDLVVKLKDDGEYPLDVDETLADLTGTETAMIEEYLGGWEHFGGGSTRSVIVTIWLAKRQAGLRVSLEEVAETKGLIFGDVLDLKEMNGGPPVQAAQAAASSPDDQPSTDRTSEDSGTGI